MIFNCIGSLFFFFLLFVPLEGKFFRCDYQYFGKIDGWLKLHRIPANWREARLRCHLEGGNLASPLNENLERAMRQMMWTNNVTYGGIYTGVHATFSSGDFFSIEGVPLRKIPLTWAKGQPDNDNDEEDCIVMRPEGTVADVNCAQPFPYICYRKTTTMIKTNCGTLDPEYSLDLRTGSCYKFHKTPRSWSRAYMACAAEGGYLAIINSEAENEVIKELFIKNPEHSIPGIFRKDLAFVGFHDWGEHGEWLTIQGQTLQEAGFHKFSNGEPNNVTKGEYCGSVCRQGALFNDLWCEEKFTFICEKSPDSLLCGDEK